MAEVPDDHETVVRTVPRFGIVFDELSVRAGQNGGAPFVAFVLTTTDLSVATQFILDVPGAEYVAATLRECIDACKGPLDPAAQNGKRLVVPGGDGST
jgi:hypothetical protein